MKGSRIPGPAVGNLGLVLREEKEANRKAKHSLPQTDSGFFGMFTRGLNPGTQAPPGLLLCPSESSVPNTLQQVGQAPGPGHPLELGAKPGALGRAGTTAYVADQPEPRANLLLLSLGCMPSAQEAWHWACCPPAQDTQARQR